ncbi:MAG: CvpA family protein [Betaproteobacteria bacterium]|nr:CvpA family protein [Betaproteobacteria bacterium]
MTWVDHVVLAIIGLSVLLSVIRGLVREVLALAAWIVAFIFANLYGATVAGWMPAEIPSESLRMLAGFLAVFLATLLVMSVLAIAVSELVKSAGLGIADRGLGALFGLARGVLIVMVLVLLAGLTSLPRHPAWRNAMLSPPLEAYAAAVKAWLPRELANRIAYE